MKVVRRKRGRTAHTGKVRGRRSNMPIMATGIMRIFVERVTLGRLLMFCHRKKKQEERSINSFW